MFSPHIITPALFSVTAPLSALALEPIDELEGARSLTVQARLAYGSGGSSIRAWLQTTLDAGQTWIDLACFAFTTASAIRIINLSTLTPVTSPVAPTDGTMADGAVLDGIIGSAIRAKVTTLGTYANTVLSLSAAVR